jgi:urease accessory protein
MGLDAFVSTLDIAVPFVEQGIVLSVLVLGVLVAAAVRLSLFAGTLIVVPFAAFHGHAHGVEMPANALGVAYGIGFAVATAILDALGQSAVVRVTGGAIAMSSVYLWLAA